MQRHGDVKPSAVRSNSAVNWELEVCENFFYEKQHSGHVKFDD
jgi:hypothetical protein